MDINNYIYKSKDLMIASTALTVQDVAAMLAKNEDVDVFYQLLAFTNFVHAREIADTQTHVDVLRDALAYYTATAKRNILFDISPMHAVAEFIGPHAVSLAQTLVGLGYEPHTNDFVNRLEAMLSACYPAASALDFDAAMGVLT